MWLFLIFIGWPLTEIALYVTLGAWIGLWPTLLIVLGTAVLGGYVIRHQGQRAIAEARATVSGFRQSKAGPMADSVFVVLAGVLLILPGFLTDMLGLVLLVPTVRHLMLARVLREFLAAQVRPRSTTASSSDADVIDGEFIEIDPPARPTHTPSGWTRH